MTTPDAFRRAIWQERDNDALRIALADWLEDHGGEEYAEFIRVGCGLARTPDTIRRNVYSDWTRTTAVGQRYEPNPTHEALRAREQELWLDRRADWGRFDGCGPLHDACNQLSWWRRGFVYMVECSWGDWVQWHPAILDAAPLERVVLTTEPPVEWGRLKDTAHDSRDCRLMAGTREQPVPATKWHEVPYTTHPRAAIRRIQGTVLAAEWPRLAFDLSRLR